MKRAPKSISRNSSSPQTRSPVSPCGKPVFSPVNTSRKAKPCAPRSTISADSLSAIWRSVMPGAAQSMVASSAASLISIARCILAISSDALRARRFRNRSPISAVFADERPALSSARHSKNRNVWPSMAQLVLAGAKAATASRKASSYPLRSVHMKRRVSKSGRASSFATSSSGMMNDSPCLLYKPSIGRSDK